MMETGIWAPVFLILTRCNEIDIVFLVQEPNTISSVVI